MKNRFSFIIIILSFLQVFTLNSYGQFSIGVRSGLDISYLSNFSQVKSWYGANDSVKVTGPGLLGFQGGFLCSYMFSKNVGLQMEFIYSQMGGQTKVNYPYQHKSSSGETYKTNINYLTIPVVVKAGWEMEDFRFYGLLGWYVGIGLSGKETASYNGTEIERKVSFTRSDYNDSYIYLHRIDFGLVFGINPCVKIGPGDLFLDLRYELGVLDIYNYEDEYDDYVARNNRNIGISAGYIFHFGG
jgi:hypothetical protein